MKKQIWTALELPCDVTADEPRFIMEGSRRLLAENIRGIAEVTGNRVRLAVRGGVVTVDGSSLLIGEVRPGALAVSGEITSISFLRENRHD